MRVCVRVSVCVLCDHHRVEASIGEAVWLYAAISIGARVNCVRVCVLCGASGRVVVVVVVVCLCCGCACVWLLCAVNHSIVLFTLNGFHGECGFALKQSGRAVGVE